MTFISTIRFQETYAMLTRLFSQESGYQRAITITRDNISRFVLLPLSLYKQFAKVLQPYASERPFLTRHMGISAMRRCFLSYERTLQAFEDDDEVVDALLILRHNELIGAVFAHDHYVAFLDFLAEKGVVLQEAFNPLQHSVEQGERLMTIVEAVHHFRDFPRQFAQERAEHGLSLPVLISRQGLPVLVLMSEETCQMLMQSLREGICSHSCQTVLDWWAHHGVPQEEQASVQ